MRISNNCIHINHLIYKFIFLYYLKKYGILHLTKARDAQTGILPGQEPDGGRIFFIVLSHSIYLLRLISIYVSISSNNLIFGKLYVVIGIFIFKLVSKF